VGGFATTNWTLILQARAGGSTAAELALAALCETYWRPAYAFLRRTGLAPEDAEDLTQAYFARFLEKRVVQELSPAAGRFRSFLLVSLRNFLANERDRERALKRGGGRPPLSLEASDPGRRYRLEPVDGRTPEDAFERQWVASLLERALERLTREQSGDRRERYERLKPLLTGDAPSSYAEVAAKLGMAEGSVRVAVHRLRRRFGELLREEIARTTPAADIEDELRHLIDLAGRPT
jgi:RNA polymerase sigma-70 factor (ECF subfamily)